MRIQLLRHNPNVRALTRVSFHTQPMCVPSQGAREVWVVVPEEPVTADEMKHAVAQAREMGPERMWSTALSWLVSPVERRI